MSVNKFICVGSIGSDAQVRTVGQNSVAKFSVATTERHKKADGTFAEETTWHDVEMWNPGGLAPYLVKGQLVSVEGAYKVNDWTDKDGNKRRSYFVRADRVNLEGARQNGGQQQRPAPQRAQRSAPTPPPSGDGDLPF